MSMPPSASTSTTMDDNQELTIYLPKVVTRFLTLAVNVESSHPVDLDHVVKRCLEVHLGQARELSRTDCERALATVDCLRELTLRDRLWLPLRNSHIFLDLAEHLISYSLRLPLSASVEAVQLGGIYVTLALQLELPLVQSQEQHDEMVGSKRLDLLSLLAAVSPQESQLFLNRYGEPVLKAVLTMYPEHEMASVLYELVRIGNNPSNVQHLARKLVNSILDGVIAEPQTDEKIIQRLVLAVVSFRVDSAFLNTSTPTLLHEALGKVSSAHLFYNMK